MLKGQGVINRMLKWKKFTQLNSYQKLKKISERAPSFSKEDTLTPERIKNFSSESAGIRLLFSTERVNKEILEALKELAIEAQCLEKMQKQQSGEVMNFIHGYPSDNRPVLHTATRDLFNQEQPNKIAKEASAFARKEKEKLKTLLPKLQKFNTLIVIGIGGSNLGPKAHYLALEKYLPKDKRVFFIDNVDPDTASKVLKQTNLKETLVLSVSKSGTTLETVTSDAFVRDAYKKAGLDPSEHFISVTTPGTPMDEEKLYFATFYIKEWVGGRFSTSSMGGGVLLAYAYGMRVYEEFLEGAHAMDLAALKEDLNKNIPLLSALLGVWNRNFLNLSALSVIPYSEALRRYPSHIQQVDMESNGKSIDRFGETIDCETGPLVFGEPGTSAQHSFFQWIHQGTMPVALEIIGVKEGQYGNDLMIDGTLSQEKLHAFLFGQMIALSEGKKDSNPNKTFLGNHPSHLLLAEKVTPYFMGALMAYYEHKIAFQGYLWNINSFDQEGVELGKEVASKILNSIKEKPGSYPLGESFWSEIP